MADHRLKIPKEEAVRRLAGMYSRIDSPYIAEIAVWVEKMILNKKDASFFEGKVAEAKGDDAPYRAELARDIFRVMDGQEPLGPSSKKPQEVAKQMPAPREAVKTVPIAKEEPDKSALNPVLEALEQGEAVREVPITTEPKAKKGEPGAISGAGYIEMGGQKCQFLWQNQYSFGSAASQVLEDFRFIDFTIRTAADFKGTELRISKADNELIRSFFSEFNKEMRDTYTLEKAYEKVHVDAPDAPDPNIELARRRADDKTNHYHRYLDTREVGFMILELGVSPYAAIIFATVHALTALYPIGGGSEMKVFDGLSGSIYPRKIAPRTLYSTLAIMYEHQYKHQQEGQPLDGHCVECYREFAEPLPEVNLGKFYEAGDCGPAAIFAMLVLSAIKWEKDGRRAEVMAREKGRDPYIPAK